MLIARRVLEGFFVRVLAVVLTLRQAQSNHFRLGVSQLDPGRLKFVEPLAGCNVAPFTLFEVTYFSLGGATSLSDRSCDASRSAAPNCDLLDVTPLRLRL